MIRTSAVARRENEEITLKEVMEKFNKHRAAGGSAPSFRGAIGVGEWTIRTWKWRFPTFAKAYNEAIEENARRSFQGTQMGPRKKRYTPRNNKTYEVHIPVREVDVFIVEAHNKTEAIKKAEIGDGVKTGRAYGTKIALKISKGGV